MKPGIDDKAALPAGFWRKLAAYPHEHDLFHVLRWIDARGQLVKRLGRAPTPRQEPLRLRQTPHMAFAPSTLSGATLPEDERPASVSIYSFGLFGPNGPLPLHLTEYVRERAIHQGDGTLAAFADIFHHRLILLFYRAWADAQDTVSLDQPDQPFSRHLACLLHLGAPAQRARDSVSDHARYGVAGHLLRQTRNPEGLVQILKLYFGVPVRLHEFVPQWVRLEAGEQTRLGGPGARLGHGALLGAAVFDASHKFRLEVGPLRLADYLDFLPGRKRALQLRDWVRQYVGIELDWDIRLVLDRRDVHGLSLGWGNAPLGLASWLGRRDAVQSHARDLLLTPDRLVPASRGT
jgi:type VI secretion system protein ImpH